MGKIVYTQFLNRAGGIEADVTVTRLSETAYLIVTPAITRSADETWLRRHLRDEFVVITDVTAAEAVIAVRRVRYFQRQMPPARSFALGEGAGTKSMKFWLTFASSGFFTIVINHP